MKEEILQKLSAIQNALDNVEVKHKQNWTVLAVSIEVIDEIKKMIASLKEDSDEKVE